MTRLFSILRDLGVAHATGALVVGLIGVDLFAGASGVKPPKAGAAPGAVQNYVLFTTVKDGAVTFTTGDAIGLDDGPAYRRSVVLHHAFDRK